MMMSTGNGDGGSSGSSTSGSGGGGGNNKGDNNTYVNVLGFGDNTVAHYHLNHNTGEGGGNPTDNSMNDGRGINNNVGGGGRERPLKKGPWTAEEDAILLEYVRKHGEGNWNAVQRNSGLNRCGKSCRLRWANHLRPNLKKGSFTHEEERLIIELHAKIGNKWARMASLLPGRTDNEIKNYWNTRIKRHQRQGLPLYPPNIQPQQQQQQQQFFQHDLHQHKSFTTPPSPFATFSFQPYQLPSPTAAPPPALPPYHHQAFAPHSSASHNAFQTLPLFDYSQQQQQNHQHPNSTPTTPTQPPFIFQTQNLDHPSSASTTPTHLSPLPSPSVANNASSIPSSHHHHIPTLALLDFSFPRPTPILQSPNRFKRFASCGDLANSAEVVADVSNNTNNNSNNAHPHHLPVSLVNLSATPPLPPHPIISFNNNIAHMGNSHNLNHPNVFSGLLDGNNIEFHKEIQKENEEMCSLLASMSRHSELPSNQILSQNPSGINASTGIINQAQFTRGIDMKKRGNNNNNNNIMMSKEKGNNNILLAAPTLNNDGNAYGGLLEDLWQEANPQLMMQRDNYVMQRNGNDVHGYTTTTNNIFSNCVEQKGDNEELSKFLEESEIQQTNNQFCGENASGGNRDHQTASNDPSSVVTTEDHINFDLHHMFSFLPTTTTTTTTTTDPDRPSLETYSWDNLPEIC